jgi:hypothetical protein
MWQFDPDSRRGFVSGLARLHEAFPGGVVSLTEWATAPNVDLAFSTPARRLALGYVDEVVDLAAAGTAAAW